AKRPHSDFDFGRDLESYFGDTGPMPPVPTFLPPVPAATPKAASPTAPKAPAAPTQSKLTPLHPALQPPAALKSPLAPAVPTAIRAPSVVSRQSISPPAAPRPLTIGSRLVAPALSSSGFRSPIAPSVSAFAPVAPIGLRAPDVEKWSKDHSRPFARSSASGVPRRLTPGFGLRPEVPPPPPSQGGL